MFKENRFGLVIILGLLISSTLWAQEIIPAAQYFRGISEQYGAIEDYQADIALAVGDNSMTGVLYYRTPNLLRIDFTDPEDQVIVVDGSELMIHLPRQAVTMVQPLTRHNDATLSTMVTGQGLNLLSRSYSISYLEFPNFVPLDEGSRESVMKLKLEWRSTDEGFRQIIISIGENGYIRRMEAITKDYKDLTYDLTNIVINQNIPEARFEFDPPPTSYTINNFLFELEE
ncbi:MAG: outer membrane lipoprotein carrier protein LolA [Spirochaetales bacterium]|nr:outer membrane lipoprotein carrier protein LolA [Spirochaetales bacterium]